MEVIYLLQSYKTMLGRFAFMEKFFEAKHGEVTIYEKLHQEVYINI